MISIVIAAYNCERYLEQAVRSVQAQSFRNVELIIVNDGSTDGTEQLAQRLAKEDERITVITQENSGGPAQPRNRGIACTTGEYICFLDPDDYWYPNKLEKQIALIESLPAVDLVFSDMHRVDENGANLGPTYLKRVNYMDTAVAHFDQLSQSAFVTRPSFFSYSSVGVVGPVTSSIVLRRSALEGLGELFPLDLLVGEDIDLWFRILEKSKAAFIDEPLHAYRQHSASLMHNQPRVTMGLIDTHSRNYARVRARLSFGQKRIYRKRIARHLFDLGYQRRLDNDKRGARIAYLRSLSWFPSAHVVLALCKTLVPPLLVAGMRGRHD